MELDRCPKCAAGVRPGADWCTLCYADLRPPAPVQAPVPAPVHASAPAGAFAASAPHAPYPPQAAAPAAEAVDPLSAAYAELLLATGAATDVPQAVAPSGEAATAAPATAHPDGWPCTACRELNEFDATACHACGTPFGLGLATPRPSYDRKQVLMWGLAVALLFVLVVGALSFFGANVEGAKSPKVPVPVGLATSGG